MSPLKQLQNGTDAHSLRPNSAAGSDRFSSDDEREVMSRHGTHPDHLEDQNHQNGDPNDGPDHLNFIVRESKTSD